MFKYIYIVVFSLLVGNGLKAQVPGYLGKRFAVGYSASLMPVLPQKMDFKGLDGSHFSMFNTNIKHRIEVNYVIKKNASLAFDVSFQEWGSLTNLDQNGKPIKLYSTSYEQERYTAGMLNEFGISDFKYINTQSTKFTFTYLKSGRIAPRGVFVAFGLSYEMIKPYMVGVNNERVDLNQINDFGYMLRLGKRRIVFDKIMIEGSVSVEQNISIFRFIPDYRPEQRTFYNVQNQSNLNRSQIETMALKQAAMHTALSVRFGIYYLL